jgi:hypothetical protein
LAGTIAANPILGMFLLPAVGAAIEASFQSIIGGLSFADGGYTGVGIGMPDPRHPGRKIVGQVHDEEYVVNKELLYAPDIAPLVNYIEMRCSCTKLCRWWLYEQCKAIYRCNS